MQRSASQAAAMKMHISAALLVLMLCSAATAQEVFYGKVQVVAVHGRDPRAPNDTALVRHEHHLNLQLKSGELRRLLFPAETHEVEYSGGATGVAGGAFTSR